MLLSQLPNSDVHVDLPGAAGRSALPDVSRSGPVWSDVLGLQQVHLIVSTQGAPRVRVAQCEALDAQFDHIVRLLLTSISCWAAAHVVLPYIELHVLGVGGIIGGEEEVLAARADGG